MSKDNLFVRMWRAISGADDKEAFAAAHLANDTAKIRAVMLEAFGEVEFKKLLPEPDPLNPGKLWKPGTDPALWGDVLLLASRNIVWAEDATKHIEAFHKAGGKICNRPDKYGNRPTDYIFNDAYGAVSYAGASYAGADDKVIRLVALVNIGVTFDPKSLRSLVWVVPKKKVVEYTRSGKYTSQDTHFVFDPENAHYERSKLKQDILDKLRENMAKVVHNSNVIPFTKSG